MKRTAIGFSSLVLLLALSLTSCDAMFTTNIFAGLTHPTPSVADVKAMSTSDLASYVDSAANIKILADNPDLKTAALDNLETTYKGSGDAATKQLAAATAATISIETVPSAAQFSGSLMGAIAGAATSGTSLSSETDLLNVLKSALGSDVASALSSGSGTPPASFTEMIDAFIAANSAYAALGTSIGDTTSGGQGYQDASITASEKNEIAVNAVISALLSSVTVASGSTGLTVEEALWDALVNPDQATTFITIDYSKVADSTSTDTTYSYVWNLLGASSLGSLMGGK